MTCTFCNKRLNPKDFVCVVLWKNDNAKESTEFCDYVCVSRHSIAKYTEAILNVASKKLLGIEEMQPKK